jgi:hypothetical protein
MLLKVMPQTCQGAIAVGETRDIMYPLWRIWKARSTAFRCHRSKVSQIGLLWLFQSQQQQHTCTHFDNRKQQGHLFPTKTPLQVLCCRCLSAFDLRVQKHRVQHSHVTWVMQSACRPVKLKSRKKHIPLGIAPSKLLK